MKAHSRNGQCVVVQVFQRCLSSFLSKFCLVVLIVNSSPWITFKGHLCHFLRINSAGVSREDECLACLLHKALHATG